MSAHDHDAGPTFDEDFWNRRYRSSAQIWSGKPNVQLVAEIIDLAPGRALDVGCGEGADAIWLARRGWEVVAVDISGVALERAAQHARDIDPVASARIEWRRTDLIVHPPDADTFDLVTSQFMHLPPQPRTRLFAALTQSVRAGGTLLVVGHHPSDLATGVPDHLCPSCSTPPIRSRRCSMTRGRWSSGRLARGQPPRRRETRSPSTTPLCAPSAGR